MTATSRGWCNLVTLYTQITYPFQSTTLLTTNLLYANAEFQASVNVTAPFAERIMSQLHEPPDEAEITLLQQKAKKEKEERLLRRSDQGLEGYFGVQDLTKIRCGNRENDKYIDRIRDLTLPWEAGLAKNWARDVGFMFACRSGMPETVTTNQF